MNTTQNAPQLCSRFGKVLAVAIMLQSASLKGNATTIDYRSSSFPADLVTSSYSYGGVTVTGGPGLLFVNVSNGLSIFGDNQYAVDAGEFINFAFDAGSATGISLQTQGGPTATIEVAGYGLGGFVGTHAVGVAGLGPAIDISDLFSNEALTHFTMTTTSGAHRPYILSFTESAVPAVPDAGSTLVLLASSLVLIAIARGARLSIRVSRILALHYCYASCRIEAN
jgi:hypothetical protein